MNRQAFFFAVLASCAFLIPLQVEATPAPVGSEENARTNSAEVVRCVYSESLKALPPLRGVMSPMRPMTEDDFRTLHDWGVRLLRYQMNRNWGARNADRDLDDYDRWLGGKLDHLESFVLPMADKYGMKVVIDLHMPPGGKGEGDEMNMFHEPDYAKHFVLCWMRIAKRFKGKAAVFGYDLVNEPVQKLPPAKGMDCWTLQRKTAERIRMIDPDTPIIVESNLAASPYAFPPKPFDLKDIIYQVHIYIPVEYTHQRVFSPGDEPRKWPDPSRGWERDFCIRERILKPVRDFQLKYGARIYVGEFSAICWAEGADRYLADCISLFEEFGWDWTYHAFREWPGWSVEHEGPDKDHLVPSVDNPRKRVLLSGLRGEFSPGRCQTESVGTGPAKCHSLAILDLADDERKSETARIQGEIDRATAQGGGRVVLSRGVHPCGTLYLKSGVELHLEEGAVLLGGDRSEDYDDAIPLREVYSYANSHSNTVTRKAFIYAENATNVAITGKGVIDGQGPKFFDRNTLLWGCYWAKPPCMRPRMVVLMHCKGVRFEETTFKDCPVWTMWLRHCEDVVASKIRVVAEQKMINSDGIDFDACRNVRVGDSYFKTGDDCLILRAIRHAADAGREVVTENVVVSNCYLNSACQGVRIGCPSDDLIRNAVFRDIMCEGNNAIFADQQPQYLEPGDAGSIRTRDILFENWTIRCRGYPISVVIQDGVRLKDFGHMTFRNVRVDSSKPIRLCGNESSLLRDVTVEGISGFVRSHPSVEMRQTTDVRLKGVSLEETDRPVQE